MHSKRPRFQNFPSNYQLWALASCSFVTSFFLLHLLKILSKTLWWLLYLKQNVQIVTLPCPMECRCISCSNLNPVMSIVGNNIHYIAELWVELLNSRVISQKGLKTAHTSFSSSAVASTASRNRRFVLFMCESFKGVASTLSWGKKTCELFHNTTL